jgi:L,D-transpeptidase YcbB
MADGLAGPATLAALNGADDADKVDTIIVNMERWRWLPRDWAVPM